MCENPIEVYVCRRPKMSYGNFYINTRQYREIVQLDKEYIFFVGKNLNKYWYRFEHCERRYLPCGKCIQCLNSRAKSWEIRSSLEHQKYKKSCCLTLTYNDEHLPTFGVLKYKDVQDFMKRLRKRVGLPIKYMCSGEYGGIKTRPHYHVIIFGYCPDDLRLYARSKKGTALYKSALMTELWQNGFVDVGQVTHQTCRYVSQYCCKKLLNETVKMPARYKRIYDWKVKKQREFIHCSIRFGLDWFKRNYRSVISQGKIVFGKFTYAVPRYFVKKLEEIDKKLFDSFKEKTHSFWCNFKNDDKDKMAAAARSDKLLRKLNLFHSDKFGLLCAS